MYLETSISHALVRWKHSLEVLLLWVPELKLHAFWTERVLLTINLLLRDSKVDNMIVLMLCMVTVLLWTNLTFNFRQASTLVVQLQQLPHH